MNINIKIEGLKALRERLDPAIIAKATSKTLNDMATAVKTETAQQIGGQYTLPAARIKQGITVKFKASPSQLMIELQFTGTPPGLQNYKMTLRKGRQMKKGYRRPSVSVMVKKGGGRKAVQCGFVMPGKKPVFAWGRYISGKFIHDTKAPYPIALKGPSIRGMFREIGGVKIVEQVLSDRLNKTFWRHFNFYNKNKKGTSSG